MNDVTPLWAPLYGASFTKAVSRFFKKYGTFSGRASKSEFWWAMLFMALVQIVLWTVFLIATITAGSSAYSGGEDAMVESIATNPMTLGVGVLIGIWALAVLIPTLALSARRLHDINLSALWLLLYFTGFGSIFILIVGLIPSNQLGARFDKPGVTDNE